MTYLEQSINSVLTQSYKNIEYIFVDGGSTDGTLERIAVVKGDVKVLHNVRGGIANAMNKGIEVATGDIIAHMHSDDYYLSNDVFTKVVNLFIQHNCKWLYGRIMSDIDSNLYSEGYIVPAYSYSTLLKSNIIPHAATFLKRELFNEVKPFSCKYKLAMDYELWLRIGKLYEPIQTNDYLAAFRRHSGSATQANKIRSFNEDFKARFTYAPIYMYPEFALRYLVRRFKLVRVK
jgi:glycosyltransferase involved in cell wall biosynthesis